jgi:hypothetical protein
MDIAQHNVISEIVTRYIDSRAKTYHMENFSNI